MGQVLAPPSRRTCQLWCSGSDFRVSKSIEERVMVITSCVKESPQGLKFAVEDLHKGLNRSLHEVMQVKPGLP